MLYSWQLFLPQETRDDGTGQWYSDETFHVAFLGFRNKTRIIAHKLDYFFIILSKCVYSNSLRPDLYIVNAHIMKMRNFQVVPVFKLGYCVSWIDLGPPCSSAVLGAFHWSDDTPAWSGFPVTINLQMKSTELHQQQTGIFPQKLQRILTLIFFFVSAWF